MNSPAVIPAHDCLLCPRLRDFRERNRQAYPRFFNGAVPSFGELSARLLIVGLAPGLKGANATGRPFTGDYAGDVLYRALLKHGPAQGEYGRRADDGLKLAGCRITNAVRCVPPENKPENGEIKTCNAFLRAEIAAMPELRVILTLGNIAHKAVLTALGLKQSAYKFAHGGEHAVPSLRGPRAERGGTKQSRSPGAHSWIASPPAEARNDGLLILNSYHCSRYNINTGRLTEAMFDAIMERAERML